jgi:hypothetical protein
MATALGHEMSDEHEQMSDGFTKHVHVTAGPLRGSDLEFVVAVIEPELNSQTSSKFWNECRAKFRQLAKFRQSELGQTPKNHLLRIGPSTASNGSARNFKWSSDAQDSEESQ